MEASRALAEAYPASWRRNRRSAHIDLWAASATLDWLSALNSHSVDILDIGCGAVWLTDELSRYGAITGIDCVHLNRPASVRALARGEYADDPALLPRYHTTGAASAQSGEGFGVALALAAPTLPGDFEQFCRHVADVLIGGGWFVWNPPTHHSFNNAFDWPACLGAEFSILNVAQLTTPFDPKAEEGSESLIMLARRNDR